MQLRHICERKHRECKCRLKVFDTLGEFLKRTPEWLNWIGSACDNRSVFRIENLTNHVITIVFTEELDSSTSSYILLLPSEVESDHVYYNSPT